jgi:gliding motility-associated-like protein
MENTYQVGSPGSYSPYINSGNCNNGVLKINLFDLKVDFIFDGELKCPATLTLFNTSQNAESYTWFFGNGDSLQSNSSTITYKYEIPGKYQVTLRAFNPKTCTREAFAFDSITIPNPFPFNSSSKSDQYCVSDSLFPIFEDLANYNLRWSPTIYLSDPASYKPVVTPLSSVNYTITIKDPQGCELKSFYKIRNREIDLGFGYEKSFKPCLGEYTVRYFSNRDSSDVYTWYFENGDSASGPEITRVYNSNGRFPVRLNGRKNNCVENAIDTINLNQQKISVIPDFSTFKIHQSCDQPSIKFVNKTINGDAFTWDFGDGFKSIDPDPEHTYETPGTYKVTLDVYKDNCRTELVRKIDVVKFSIPTLITSNEDGINDNLEITGLESGWKLDIYNRWGKSVYQTDNYKNDWKAVNLQEGTYFYNITFPDGYHCNGWVHAAKP